MRFIFSVAAAAASIRNTSSKIWPAERKLKRSWVVAEPAMEANGGIR